MTTALISLPPLILHPFGGEKSTEQLLAGSRASLALQGMLDTRNRTADEETELERQVLIGRYQEIRMLLFLGKDLYRWLLQCVDCVERSRFADPRITEQSFAAMVVENPPLNVRTKLEGWGVTDRKAVFSRAIGINSLFAAPPPADTLSPLFLRSYHRYADHAYICFQHLKPYYGLDTGGFEFDLYASDEYARILSQQWEHA